MILLVTPIESRDTCAASLKEATGEPVVTAETLAEATTLLRTGSYTIAVFDQHLAEREPHETDTAFEHLGSAIPVQINFAISGLERLVREVRLALRRWKQEQAITREEASRALRGEFNDTVTTLLLDCELALDVEGFPEKVTELLASALETAQKLRAQLEAGLAII